MNYELKDTEWMGAPRVKASDDTKVQVHVNVKTGVVGDTYDFCKVDTVVMDFPISMTGTEMQADTITQAIAYSADKYPNT